MLMNALDEILVRQAADMKEPMKNPSKVNSNTNSMRDLQAQASQKSVSIGHSNSVMQFNAGINNLNLEEIK